MTALRVAAAMTALTTALTVVVLLASPSPADPPAADMLTHYLDNQDPACTDSGPGTSPSAPWCSFTPITAISHATSAPRGFGPGAQLLLARGRTWTTQLEVTGYGSAAAPITIGAYCVAPCPAPPPRPRIALGDASGQAGVFLWNPAHVVVQDLEIDHAQQGVVAYYCNNTGTVPADMTCRSGAADDNGSAYTDLAGQPRVHQGLDLRRLSIHHIRGIYWPIGDTTVAAPAASTYRFSAAITIKTVRCAGTDIQTGTQDIPYSDGSANFLTVRTFPHCAQGDNAVAIDGVTVDRVESTRNLTFFTADTDDDPSDSRVTDVAIQNSYVHDEDGGSDSTVNGVAQTGQTKGCPFSVHFTRTEGIRMLNNVFDGVIGCYTNFGATAIQWQFSTDVSFLNNVIVNIARTTRPAGTPTTGAYPFEPNDMSAMDLESHNDNVLIAGNYVGSNYGPGLEILNAWNTIGHIGDPDYPNPTRNVHITDNYWYRNGVATNPTLFGPDAYTSSLFIVHVSEGPNLVADNLFAEPSGFSRTGTALNPSYLHSFDGATHQYIVNGQPGTITYPGFAFRDNRALEPQGIAVHQTGRDFTAASLDGQTSGLYQYFLGGTWKDMAWRTGPQEWQPQTVDAAVQATQDRFTTTPGSCTGCDAARTFVVPVGGQISINGRATLADSSCTAGDAASARITLNGTDLWTAALSKTSPTASHPSRLSDVTVNVGDVIRFQVGNGGAASNECDTVSWIPTLAYTSTLVDDWGFDQDTRLEGWHSYGATSVSGGELLLSGAGPVTIDSPDNLGVAPAAGDFDGHTPVAERGFATGAWPYLHIHAKNCTTLTAARLYYRSEADPSFTYAHSAPFSLPAPQSCSSGYPAEIVIDLRTLPDWPNDVALEQLRIDLGPVAGGQQLRVNFIRLAST